MGKKQELTYSCTLVRKDGTEVPFEDVPREELDRLANIWGERMAATLAEYFSQHPERYRPNERTGI